MTEENNTPEVAEATEGNNDAVPETSENSDAPVAEEGSEESPGHPGAGSAAGNSPASVQARPRPLRGSVSSRNEAKSARGVAGRDRLADHGDEIANRVDPARLSGARGSCPQDRVSARAL